MTFDHVLLMLGLLTFVFTVMLIATFKMRSAHLLRRRETAKYEKWQRFLNRADDFHALPILLIISGIEIVGWIVSRVVISYL